MVWAGVAKRRHWLGEEMYGIWGGGLRTKKDMDRGCAKRLPSMQFERRMLWIVVDGRKW